MTEYYRLRLVVERREKKSEDWKFDEAVGLFDDGEFLATDTADWDRKDRILRAMNNLTRNGSDAFLAEALALNLLRFAQGLSC